MKKENDSTFDADVQKSLDKLIANEMIAFNFLLGCIIATQPQKSIQYSDAFMKIAVNHRDICCKNLIDWAITNDYDVVFKFKDIEKKSDQKIAKIFNAIKNDAETNEIISNAIELQQNAVDCYQKTLLKKSIPYELHCILLQNMYAEQQHLEQLRTMSYAYDAGANLTTI